MLNQSPIPKIVERPIKNLNGDLVSDFTINKLEAIKVSGFVFQFDVSKSDFFKTLANYANKLLDKLTIQYQGPCYIIYSDCLPNTTVFKLIVGIPKIVTVDQPLFFTVDVPNLFFARILKLTRQEADPSHINMIQRFDNIQDLTTASQLYVPIVRTEAEVDLIS